MAGGIEIRAAHFPGRAPIEAYGNGGFRFAEMSHRGSLLCLPSGIYGWEASTMGAFIEADFQQVVAEHADIDILLIGTGTQLVPLSTALQGYLRPRGIVVEAMSTGAAVRTYNVLLAEERMVAAALLAVD